MNIKTPTMLSKLLKILYETEESLLDHRYIRSTNIVGEIGEYYASKSYQLEYSNRLAQKDFDLKDKKGRRYQVKTRRLCQHQNRRTKPNGLIRGLDKSDYDIAIIVELNCDYSCKDMFSISRNKINRLLKNKKTIHIKKLREVADNPLSRRKKMIYG